MKTNTRIRVLGLTLIGLLATAGGSMDAQAASARTKPGVNAPKAKPGTPARPVRASSMSSFKNGRQDRANSVVSNGRRARGQSASQVSGAATTPSAWQAPPVARAPSATAPPPLVRQNASRSLQLNSPRELQRTSSSGTLVRMTTSPPVQ